MLLATPMDKSLCYKPKWNKLQATQKRKDIDRDKIGREKLRPTKVPLLLETSELSSTVDPTWISFTANARNVRLSLNLPYPEWTTLRWKLMQNAIGIFIKTRMLDSPCIWRENSLEPHAAYTFIPSSGLLPLSTKWLEEQCYLQTNWWLGDETCGQQSVLQNVCPQIALSPPHPFGLRNVTQALAFFLKFLS